MAQFYESISDEHADFITAQKMYFTASGTGEGRINLSPKGLDSFAILGPNRVAYLDLTGSGNETSAHLRADGRLTLMFCAFEGKPMILRLFGRATVVTPADTDWAELRPKFPDLPGVRQIVVQEVDSVQTSCGMGVPLYDFKDQRRALTDAWAEYGEERVGAYQRKKNARSIDGLEPYPLPSFTEGPE